MLQLYLGLFFVVSVNAFIAPAVTVIGVKGKIGETLARKVEERPEARVTLVEDRLSLAPDLKSAQAVIYTGGKDNDDYRQLVECAKACLKYNVPRFVAVDLQGETKARRSLQSKVTNFLSRPFKKVAAFIYKIMVIYTINPPPALERFKIALDGGEAELNQKKQAEDELKRLYASSGNENCHFTLVRPAGQLTFAAPIGPGGIEVKQGAKQKSGGPISASDLAELLYAASFSDCVKDVTLYCYNSNAAKATNTPESWNELLCGSAKE